MNYRTIKLAYCLQVARTALLYLLVTSAITTPAAVIHWGAPRDIAADSDISTNGVLVKAIAKSGTAYPTVNGVTFCPAYGNDTVSGTNAANLATGALPVGGGISQSYSTLLGKNDYNSTIGSTVTLTISGLKVGYHYEIQVWYNDSNAAGQGTLTVKSAGLMDPWAQLDANTTGTAGGKGQHAIGTFTADATTQVVTFKGSANGMIQAYQVRRVTAPLAAVTWGPWQEILGDTDVSTNGNAVRAYVFGSTAPSAPINGVTFTRFATQTGDTLPGTISTNAYGSSGAPYVNLSSDYKKIVGSGNYASSAGKCASLTLNSLQPGQWYEVQVWVNDSRASTAGRWERINGSAFLNFNPGGPSDNLAYEGGLGHYMIGTFQAGAASQRFDIVANLSAQINGLQLRAIPAPDAAVLGVNQRRQYTMNSFIDGKMTSSAIFPEAQLYFASGQMNAARAAVSDCREFLASGDGYTFEMWPAMDMVIRWKKYIDTASRTIVKDRLKGINYATAGTSNLQKLAWTIRYLGSEEFGEDAFNHPADDFRVNDPNARSVLMTRFREEALTGGREIASSNYGWYNLMPTLSIAQLAKDPEIRKMAEVSFVATLAQLAPVWQKDSWIGMWSGRTYPDQGGYMGSLARLLWEYYGDGPRTGECKETGMAAVMNYMLPTPILHAGSDRSAVYSLRSRCWGFHASYVNRDDYVLFSQQYESGGFSNQSYPAGVRWKGMSSNFWLTKPASDDPDVNDGSHTHGWVTRDFSQLQHRDSVVYAFDNSHPKAVAPRYALGYIPGSYQAMVNEANTSGRIFLHYGSVMIAVSSDVPFEWNPSSGIYAPSGTPSTGDSEFRVAVGGVGDPNVDPTGYTSTISSASNRFAMAVETAHPSEYAGATPAAQLAAFRTDILATTSISHNDVSMGTYDITEALYTNRHGDTLKKQSDDDARHNMPGYINGVAVDYANWPMLENPWMSQDSRGGPLTATSGSQRTVLDFTAWTLTNTSVPPVGSLPEVTSSAATGLMGSSAVCQGNLVSTGASATSVTLYWGTVDCGTTAASWQHAQPLGDRSAGALITNLTGLTPNTTYYYRYFSSNAQGDDWSDSSVAFTTLQAPVPAVPGGFSTTLTVGAVPLSWTAASDASSYTVKRATTSGGPYTVIASGVTGTSYTDTTATPGVAYYYVVSAIGVGGESLNSGVVKTTPAVSPITPTALVGTMGYMYPHLSWIPANWATTYSVKRSVTSGGPYTTIATGLTSPEFDDATALNLNTYYYVVSSVNLVGESANSSQVSVAVHVDSFINSSSGNWNSVTWFPNPPGKPTASSTAIVDFGNSTNITSSNDMASFQLNQMRFFGSAVTLSGSALLFGGSNPALTGSATSACSIANPITLQADLLADIETHTVTLNGVIGGTYGLLKSGIGTLALGGNNSYTGNTILEGGMLSYTGSNSNVKTLVFGNSVGSTMPSVLNIAANVTANGINVQTTGVDNLLKIASGKTLTITGGYTAGGLNGGIALSNLVASGAGTFNFVNPSGTMTIRRGSALDFTALANVNLTAAAVNIGDLDNYTTMRAPILTVSANGSSTIWANAINLDSAYSGGGNGRGESSTLMAPLGSGTLTIRNTAGTGAANLYMEKHNGTGTSSATALFDARGHYVDALLATLEIGHWGSNQQGRTGFANFFFDKGVLSVANTVQVAICDTGLCNNTSLLSLAGGTVTLTGGINLGISTNGGKSKATFNIDGGDLVSGKISMAKLSGAGSSTATISMTDGTLTMTNDIVRGVVSGTGTSTATLKLYGGRLDMTGHAIGASGSTISLICTSGTLMNVASINGTDGLTQTGVGTLVIGGANTYTGPTLVSGDTLQVDGSITSDVTVNAGCVLSGSGIINGTVTVNGELAPGVNGASSLRINGALNMAATAASTISIDRAATPNCAGLAGLASATLGGSLTVTNLGVAPVLGDRFVLFNASGISGSFTTVNLPTLGTGLGWDLRNLYVDGSITVKDANPPVVTVPSNITVQAISPLGMVVSYSTSALDAKDGSVATVNTPASGSKFPVGVTTVTTTTLDSDGNIGTATFTVTVQPPVFTAFYWDTSATTGLQGGSGVWDVGSTAKWNTVASGTSALSVFNADNSANFQTGAANSITVNGTVGVGGIVQSVNNTATTISGGTLMFTGASGILNGVGSGNSALTINSALILGNALFPVNAQQPITLNGAMSGSGDLKKTGAATLTLGGANTVAGDIILDGGILTLNGDVSNMQTLLFGAIAGSTTASTLNVGANVTGQTLTVQNAATNYLTIAGGKTLTITSGYVAGGLNSGVIGSKLTATGAGTFRFNNSAGSIMVRKGSILDLSGVSTVNIIAAALNIGDLDNYTATNPSTLKVSANGQNVLWANSINLDSANLGGGNTRGESATFLAPAGSGTLTIRNAAGTGAAALYMDTHAGSGANPSTTLFDTRGHNANISLSALDISHRTGTHSGGDGTGYFYFDTGILNVSGTVLLATSDGGTASNTGTLDLGGGTVTLTGGINAATSTTSATATATINIDGGSVTSGKITLAKVTSTGAATAALNLNGGTLTMTDNIVTGPVTGTGISNATFTLNGGTLDMNQHAIGESGSAINVLSFQSGVLKNVASINGAAGLTKTGTGKLVLDGGNSYSGTTTVTTGTLEVVGTLTPGSPVMVSSTGTLSGSGSIQRAVTVSGKFIPGVNGTGTLGLTNSLTLAAGCETKISLNGTASPNSTGATGMTSVVFGGTLTVLNTGGTLAASDTFRLFDAATYSGSFSSLSLPTLVAGLAWDTSRLSVDGSITVKDILPPVIMIPGDMTGEATGPSGAIVTFTTSATDTVSGPCLTVNSPASGSTFPVGTTTVTVTASDAAGNNASRTFSVTVRDTTPPVITVPSNMTVDASSSSGAVATFTTSAADLVGGLRPTLATPASGSTFPVGTTMVTVTASDAAGNNASRTFTVTVKPWNSAPIINPIGNKTETQGQTLSFTVTATDPDAGQTLTYSLDAGAPAGATINSTSGAFNWAPSDNQPAGTYPVTFRVTDNGTPAKSGTQAITITVVNGVPIPWTAADIGNVGVTGNAAYVNGTWQVAGAGADVWGSADAFRYVYQTASGDCSITAKVTAVQNTNTTAKAGVMIRDSLATNAMEVFVDAKPNGNVSFQRRTTTGGSTTETNIAGCSVPYWVRVTRTGNIFRAYRSPDGLTWTQVGTDMTIAMGTNTYLGLGVCSKSTVTLNYSTFTNATAVP